MRCFTKRGIVLFFLASVLAVSALNVNAAEIPFEDNDSIETIRLKIAHNGYNFTVSPNSIFNMSAEQKNAFFKRRLPQTIIHNPEAEEIGPLAQYLGKALPSGFDLRNEAGHAYIGPIKDQGNCGSCYGFAAAAAAESVYNVSTNNMDAGCEVFSESYIMWSIGSIGQYTAHFYGCDGADYDYFELQALVDIGIIKESDYPYTIYEPSELYVADDEQKVSFDSWHRIGCMDIDAIKTAIMTYGAVDVAVYVTAAFQAYSSGIYEDTNNLCSAVPCYYQQANHGVALVGWNDNNGDGYWILRNSWGPEWGESGYMRIKYDSAAVSCAAAYLVPGNWTRAVSSEASSILGKRATFTGTVYPSGRNTTYYFEYGTDEEFSGSTSATSAPGVDYGIEVSAQIEGLSPETLYHYRLVAESSFGKVYGETMTFITLSLLPSVNTLSATSIGAESAVLNGTLNPNDSETIYYFEYGTDTSYSLSTQIASAGASAQNTNVSATVSGLTPGTLYHYRLVASNEEGLSNGEDLTFSTTAAAVSSDGSSSGGSGCFINTSFS